MLHVPTPVNTRAIKSTNLPLFWAHFMGLFYGSILWGLFVTYKFPVRRGRFELYTGKYLFPGRDNNQMLKQIQDVWCGFCCFHCFSDGFVTVLVPLRPFLWLFCDWFGSILTRAAARSLTRCFGSQLFASSTTLRSWFSSQKRETRSRRLLSSGAF